MKNIKLAIAIAATLTLTSGAVMAEAWDVTQSITTNGATTATQTGNTANSLQGLNTIDSRTASVQGSQAVTATSTLTLDQSGAVSQSTQAINYTKAPAIAAAGTFTQDVTTTTAVTLNQTASGNSNLQGGNVIDLEAADTLDNTIQTISGGATFAMNQGTTATVNDALQVGNGVITVAGATGGGVANQAITSPLAMTQGAAGFAATSSTQAGNYLGARQ